MNNLETVIGLEVHVELKTQSKMFSAAPVTYAKEQNTSTIEVDWGYPGTLPTVNKGAIEFGMKAALALNCKINQETMFDRKHYFYPDNPKAYQITQDKYPIGYDGWIEIDVHGEKKKIGIERIHIEEDAGKNTHADDGYSYVDLNRQGTPLVEIVSKADMRDPEEAYAYLETLRQILQFTGVSDVKMEEGSMRCDANVSLRPYGSQQFGTKTELKNLNSISNVKKGIEFEQARQTKILLSGGVIQQETRRFDDTTNTTILMRVKEGASDYRYFPEPDLPYYHIEDEWVERIHNEMPEMPSERRKRYVNELGLSDYDAHVLTLTKEMSDFFDETVACGAEAKQVANWLMGEVSAYLNKQQIELNDTKLTPNNLAEMIQLIQDGTISSKMAKKVFMELIKNGGSAKQVVEDKGLVQLSDPKQLQPIVSGIVDEHPESVELFKKGKERAVGFLVGQVMKQTKGQANPAIVNQLIKEELQRR